MKKINRLKKRIPLLLTLGMILTSVIPMGAFAADKIDTEKPISLTVTYVDTGVKVWGSTFKVYRVADVDEYANMTLCDPFTNYVDEITGLSKLKDLKETEWDSLAATLTGYVQRDQIEPEGTAVTDENGEAPFTVKAGLYFVLGSKVTLPDNYTYTPYPYMVFLPDMDLDQNAWSYEVISAPKHDPREPQAPEQNNVTRKVTKAWSDKGYETDRPESITVDLLCDGKVEDTKTITAKDNWRYEWTELDGSHEWTIVERTVKGYTVSSKQQGVTTALTNQHDPVKEKPPIKKGKLPATGLLWWPAAAMLAVGLLFVIIGICRYRTDD